MNRPVYSHQPVKGLAFTRLAIAVAMGRGSTEGMEGVAAARFGADSLPARIAKAGGIEVLIQQKAEVAAGASVSGNWAELLVDAESAAAEFFALVRERSLLGRIPGLRRVPLHTRLIGAATGFSAVWVGEGKAIPVSTATFEENSIDSLKVATLTVVTNELLKSADPAAEVTIRDDLVNAVAAAINTSFIHPANGGTPGIEPASVTNGAPSVIATGDGLADIRQLIDLFPGDLERAVLVGSAETFAAMHDPVVLPGLGVRGGSALGIPAIASASAGSDLALIDPAGIALGEGTTDIRASGDATIEMDTNPTQSGVADVQAAQMVSLWQCNATALLAEQTVNWEVVRPSVAVLEGVPQS